jgi:hypothetical protein
MNEQVQKWIEERRFASVYCCRDYLLDVLRNHVGKGYYVAVPTAETVGIPDDAYVVDVHEDWATRCLWVLMAHGSFEPVPDGEPSPNLMAQRCYVMVKLKKVPGEPLVAEIERKPETWRDRPQML